MPYFLKNRQKTTLSQLPTFLGKMSCRGKIGDFFGKLAQNLASLVKKKSGNTVRNENVKCTT